MLGENIKELRLERGLTQKQLAEKIGASQGAVFFWEKEINEPTAGYVVKMAEIFGISTDELLSAETTLREQQSKENEFVKKFSQLTETQQNIVLAMIDSLSAK